MIAPRHPAMRLLLLSLAAALLVLAQSQPKEASKEDLAKIERVRQYMLSMYKHDPKVHPFHWRARLGVNAQGVRGIFATEDIPSGGVILTLPAGATLNVGGDTGDDGETTVRLMAELRNPATRHKPYFDYIPKPGGVVNYCNFPEEYVPMLQSHYWESLLRGYRERLASMLAGTDHTHGTILLEEAIGGNHNVTLSELAYACALVTTRVVSMSPRKTTVMIPMMDLANHRKDCPVILGAWSHLGEWDTDVHLVATSPIKKGEELCYSYGDHRDDHMLIYYGFMPWLPDGRDSDQLFIIDHYKISPGDDGHHHESGGPDLSALSSTTPEQARAEQARLRNLLISLDEDLKVNPNPGPVKGWEGLYDHVLEYQRRRRAAIRAEIAALQRIVDGTHGSEL